MNSLHFEMSANNLISVLTVLLQITAILGISLALACFPFRHKPSLRHGILLSALISVVILPATVIGIRATGGRPWIEIPVSTFMQSSTARAPASSLPSWNSTPEAGTTIESKNQTRTQTGSARRENVLEIFGSILLFVWSAVACFYGIRLLRGWHLTLSLRRNASVLDPHIVGDLRSDVESAVGVQILPPILVSTEIHSPISLGLIRPVVLLPAQLLSTLDAKQLQTVLIHECAHIRRFDHLIGFFQRLIEMAFWPHPLIRLVNRELSRAREEICDNFVLRATEPTDYARTLLHISQQCPPFNWQPFSSLGIIQVGWSLEERVAGLLNSRRNRATSVSRRALLAVTFGVAAIVAGVASVGPQPSSNYATRTPLHPDFEAVKEIQGMERALEYSMAKDDRDGVVAVFQRYLAEDFTVNGESGLADKSQFLELVRWKNPEEGQLISFHMDDQSNRLVGNTVISTGRFLVHRKGQGKVENEESRYTFIWVQRQSRWRIVHFQLMRVTPEPE